MDPTRVQGRKAPLRLGRHRQCRDDVPAAYRGLRAAAFDFDRALEQSLFFIDLEGGEPSGDRENMAGVGVADIEQFCVKEVCQSLPDEHAAEGRTR